MIIKCRVCGRSRTRHDSSARQLLGICGRCARIEREAITALSLRYPPLNKILRFSGRSRLIARVAKR